MAGNRETALKNLEKAHQSPDIGKRGPSKTTLDKEAARKIYLERMSQQFESIVDIHLAEAQNPDNVVERKEALHQMIGKPVETMEVTQTTTLRVDV